MKMTFHPYVVKLYTNSHIRLHGVHKENITFYPQEHSLSEQTAMFDVMAVTVVVKLKHVWRS
jgi:hypothetical protein